MADKPADKTAEKTAAKPKEKEFVCVTVLVDGTSFTGKPMSEGKAREVAEEVICDGACNGDIYYPASQIKRVKVNEHIQ